MGDQPGFLSYAVWRGEESTAHPDEAIIKRKVPCIPRKCGKNGRAPQKTKKYGVRKAV